MSAGDADNGTIPTWWSPFWATYHATFARITEESAIDLLFTRNAHKNLRSGPYERVKDEACRLLDQHCTNEQLRQRTEGVVWSPVAQESTSIPYIEDGAKDDNVVRSDNVDVNEILAIVGISRMCLESYPCQHSIHVRVRNRNETIGTRMNGRRIYELCARLRLPIPKHLLKYGADATEKST